MGERPERPASLRIPRVYLPPHGTPLYWLNEQSGVLPAAVRAFFDHLLAPEKPFSGQQVADLREYLNYAISAPCWHDNGEGTLAELRASVATLDSAQAIAAWLDEAQDRLCLDLL